MENTYWQNLTEQQQETVAGGIKNSTAIDETVTVGTPGDDSLADNLVGRLIALLGGPSETQGVIADFFFSFLLDWGGFF